MNYLVIAIALFTIFVAHILLKDSNLPASGKAFVYANVILNASNGALWWIQQLNNLANE